MSLKHVTTGNHLSKYGENILDRKKLHLCFSNEQIRKHILVWNSQSLVSHLLEPAQFLTISTYGFPLSLHPRPTTSSHNTLCPQIIYNNSIHCNPCCPLIYFFDLSLFLPCTLNGLTSFPHFCVSLPLSNKTEQKHQLLVGGDTDPVLQFSSSTHWCYYLQLSHPQHNNTTWALYQAA